MVQAIIELDEETNRVLNIIKAQRSFRNKSEAVGFVVSEYAEMAGQPELRLDFVERVREAERGRFIKVDDFAKQYLK
jgi:hypothetical protein